MTLPDPTIGRIVNYRGKDGDVRAAIVTQVHGVFCLNLHVFGRDSSDPEAGPKTSVTHAQPEHEPGCFPSWHWMPYQLGQAARTIEAEAKAAVVPEPVQVSLGQIAYEAYCASTGWKSLVSGADLPPWSKQKPEIAAAWEAAAVAVKAAR